jgi:hypothetical protein
LRWGFELANDIGSCIGSHSDTSRSAPLPAANTCHLESVQWALNTRTVEAGSFGLTSRGKELIVPAFRKHAGQMRSVFFELSAEDLCGLAMALKKVDKRAAALMEQT